MHRPIWQLELGFHPSHQLPISWNRLKKKVGKRFIEKVSGGHSLRLPLKDTFDRDLVLEIDDVENRISLPYNTRIISPRSIYIILLSFQNCDIFYTIFSSSVSKNQEPWTPETLRISGVTGNIKTNTFIVSVKLRNSSQVFHID